MQITPVSNALGANVSDVALDELTDDQAAQLVDAWSEYGVLFFRDQHLTPDQHKAFARRFGDIDINRFFNAVDGYPEIAEVLKEADQTANIGGGWHTDHSYDPAPARGSILYAHEIPPIGGDTCFIGMGAAYDALSPPLQDMLGSLTATHSGAHVFGRQSPHRERTADRIGNPDAVRDNVSHPVVIAHPDTGRPTLYVNPGFTTKIDGLTIQESRALLGFLFEHCQRPEFQIRFEWAPGSLAMWDNRSTWHFAVNDYHGHRRYLHRITVAGSELAAAF
ncbi:MAG: taurine dioxygenase [Acidimicrobiaceae bacterium]|nr:taurine dioxygenase [Acidimicrobiaceae bacterium]